MGFVVGILGAAAVLAGPIAAWVAFQSFRDGDASMGWKAVAVACVAGFAFVTVSAPYPPKMKDDCRVDWDGRTNSTVCD